ncbi:MAG: hypothetical protein JSW39_16825 [Desulfobacterales bacterium]|nr:MAG: hypothetical protein JSW39_16825 [Desulfobacterales bacterium]
MAAKLIQTKALPNGLTLELYDASRKVAGDRWRVSLIAAMDIHLNGLPRSADDPASFKIDEIRRSLGAIVRFEQKRERNFIGSNQKEEVLGGLLDAFLTSSLAYLSHPDFARRFLLKQYKAYLARHPASCLAAKADHGSDDGARGCEES